MRVAGRKAKWEREASRWQRVWKGELIAKRLDMGVELVSKRPKEVCHYGDGTRFKMKIKRRAYDMLRQESVMCN